MPATLKEFLSEICADSSALFANEESTKLGAVQPILSFLGWNNIREVQPEFPVGSVRVDYCLMSGPRKVFIEAKVAGSNLSGHQQQLLEYAFRYGVELAALTTGLEWWLYLPLKRGAWQERQFAVIDVQKEDDAANRLTTFLSRGAIVDGSAFQAAEMAIIDKNLPRVWNELYKEQRDFLVESLGRKLRDQTGYEPLQPHLEYFLDRQVGASSGPNQWISGTPQDAGSGNPFRSGSRFAQLYDALLRGLSNERGIEELAGQLGIDPRNARLVFQRGHGGIGDRGRWHLTMEGDIERLIPEASQLAGKSSDSPSPPVAIMSLLEEIRQAVTGPSFPKAEWYATQTPDYRAKVVLTDDLSRVFVRITWAKDWVWVKLKDVGKYKVSKPGEMVKLRDQIQTAYQKAEQHLQDAG
jgi:hypothetical protein